MGVLELSPRLPSTEARRPVFPNGRRPTWLVLVIASFALAPVAIVVFDDRAGLRTVMAALAATILGLAICVHLAFATIRERMLRVDDTASGVWFRPAATTTALPFIAGALLVLPAAAQIAVDTAGLPTFESFLMARAPYALGVLGLVVVGVRAARSRQVAGLHLMPDGLVGIRGRGRIRWGWDELDGVDVGSGPVAALNLVHVGGSPRVEAPMIALGSDPNQVAVIVRYFRDHPRERVHLAGGAAEALRRVDDVLRAREDQRRRG